MQLINGKMVGFLAIELVDLLSKFVQASEILLLFEFAIFHGNTKNNSRWSSVDMHAWEVLANRSISLFKPQLMMIDVHSMPTAHGIVGNARLLYLRKFLKQNCCYKVNLIWAMLTPTPITISRKFMSHFNYNSIILDCFHYFVRQFLYFCQFSTL